MVPRIVAHLHGKSFLEHAVFSVIPIHSSNKPMFFIHLTQVLKLCGTLRLSCL